MQYKLLGPRGDVLLLGVARRDRVMRCTRPPGWWSCHGNDDRGAAPAPRGTTGL